MDISYNDWDVVLKKVNDCESILGVFISHESYYMSHISQVIDRTHTLFSALFFFEFWGIQQGEVIRIGTSGIVLNSRIIRVDNIPHKCKPMMTGIRCD